VDFRFLQEIGVIRERSPMIAMQKQDGKTFQDWQKALFLGRPNSISATAEQLPLAGLPDFAHDLHRPW